MPPRPSIPFQNAAEMKYQLGGIALERICMNPPPGLATESDLIRFNDRQDHLYELIHGTLVEKVIGSPESYLAMRLGRILDNFIDEHDLGILLGPDGPQRILPGEVRLPDVSFISWDKLPKRKIPTDPIFDLVPDLAVEIISPSNTRSEMRLKLKNYFLAGVRVVWFIDPRTRTAQIYSTPSNFVTLTEAETIDGGEVVPEFQLPLAKLFAQMPIPPKPKRKRSG